MPGIVGEDPPDVGDVVVPKRTTIGYFRQEMEDLAGQSVLDATIAGCGRVGELLVLLVDGLFFCAIMSE